MNRRLFCLMLYAATGVLAGCSSSKVPVSDPDAAHELLSTSLEAWKANRTPNDLRYEDSPVYVAEEFWHSAFRLEEFTIDGPGEIHGTNIRFRATLKGVTADGQAFMQQVKYLVTTTPARTIAREDP